MSFEFFGFSIELLPSGVYLHKGAVAAATAGRKRADKGGLLNAAPYQKGVKRPTPPKGVTTKDAAPPQKRARPKGAVSESKGDPKPVAMVAAPLQQATPLKQASRAKEAMSVPKAKRAASSGAPQNHIQPQRGTMYFLPGGAPASPAGPRRSPEISSSPPLGKKRPLSDSGDGQKSLPNLKRARAAAVPPSVLRAAAPPQCKRVQLPLRDSGPSKRVCIGTLCSGLEAPCIALEAAGIKYDLEFSCDVSEKCRDVIKENFPCKMLLKDALELPTDLPSTDVLIWGAPCQGFSSDGDMMGFEDVRSDVLISTCVCVTQNQPKAFIMENVPLLKCGENEASYKVLKRMLTGTHPAHHGAKKYKVTEYILNSLDYSLPQNRPRLYLVGIREDVAERPMRTPNKLSLIPMEKILDRFGDGDDPEKLPPATQTVARRHVLQGRVAILKAGFDPDGCSPTIVGNVDSVSLSWRKDGASPCLTASRMRQGHWIFNRGRRLHLHEGMRLMGIPSGRVKRPEAVSVQQLGHMVGNSMAVPVLRGVFKAIHDAAPAVFRGQVPK